MKTLRIAAVAAVAALALTSCGKTVDLAAPVKAGPATSSSSSTSSESGNFPTPEPADLETSATPDEPEAPTEIRFGDTWEWEDGMQVTVSKPKKFKPSDYAAGTDGYTKFVQFTVTVKNGTSKKVDLIGMADAASGDTEAHEVFDSGKGISGSPSTSILPGRKVTYKVAFGVQDPNDIVFQYGPTFDHEDAIFTSK